MLSSLNNPRSALVDESLVAEALKIARPAIANILNHSERSPDARFVYVVVLNPVVAGDMLYEDFFGEGGGSPERRKKRYDLIARSKARIAQRTGLDTGNVVACSPALLLSEETLFEGGVNVGGVPVGVSGVESFLDEAIARVIASVINGLAKQRLEQYRSQKVAFLP
jgi:hypothetical protein